MSASASWLWGGDESHGTKPDPGAAFRPPGTASPSMPPPQIGVSRSSPQLHAASPSAQTCELAGSKATDGVVDGAPLPPVLPSAASTSKASVEKPPLALSLAGCSSMPQLQLRPTGILQPGRAAQAVRSAGKSFQVQDKISPRQKQGQGDEESIDTSLSAVPPLWSTLAGEQLGALSRELASLRQEVLCLKKGAPAGQFKSAGPGSIIPSKQKPTSQPSCESTSSQATGNRDQVAQVMRELVSLRKDVDSVQFACSKCEAGVKQARELASTGQVQGGPEPKPTNEKLAAVLGEFDRTMKSWLQRRLDEQAREQERREGDQRKAWEGALDLRTKSLEASMREIEERLTGEVQQLAAEHKTAESVMRDVFVEQCSGVEKTLARSTLEIRQETRRALDEIEVRLRAQSSPSSNDNVPADSRLLWKSDLQNLVEAMAQLEHEQDNKYAALGSSLQELDKVLRDEIRQSLESHHEVQADAIQQAMNQLVQNLNNAFTTYKTENQAQIDHAVDELAKAKLGFQQTREQQAPEVSGREMSSVPVAALPASSITTPQATAERQTPMGVAVCSILAEPGRLSPSVPSRSPPSSPVEVQAQQTRGTLRASWSGQRAQNLRSAQPG